MSWMCLANLKKNILTFKNMGDKIEEVYEILTARKIRKAWPTNPETVKNAIKYYLETNQPIVLVTNWLGVKTTERGVADKADKAALFFLKKNIIEKCEEKNIKIIIKILFTDINASYLEGYTKDRIELYWKTLKPIVDSYGKSFKIIKVNEELWNNLFKLDGNETLELDEIAKATNCLDILDEVKEKADKIINSSRFETYKNWASKHSLLVKKGMLTLDEAAKRYIRFRLFARRRYKKMFPYEIYFTSSIPELQLTEFVSQPTIYIFFIYKGFSDCPWFIDENHEGLVRLIKMGRVNV